MKISQKRTIEELHNVAGKRLKRRVCTAIAAVILALLSLPTLSHAEVVDRIVAVINDHIITLSELNTATNVALDNVDGKKPANKKSIFEFRNKALETLINRKLIKQASDAAGIDVNEREIDSAIEDVKKENNLTKEKLMLALAQNGLTMREYREQLKEQIREVKFVDIEFKSKISVLDDEVEDYYRQNINEFLQAPTFRARMIFLPGTDKSVQKKRLAIIEDELKKKVTFEELARQYSEGPNAQDGGDLGWLSKGELDPALELELEKLKINEVSQKITRPEGIYLLQLTRSREAEPASITESTPAIQKTLFNRRMEKRYNSWLKEARKSAHIEIRL